MAVKITSKKEAVEKAKWLRKQLTEWERKYLKGDRFVGLDPKEKREFMNTLRAVEKFVFQIT